MTDPTPPTDEHEAFQILMMGSLDGEISDDDDARLREHLAQCPSCSEELVRYRRLADVAAAARLREPQDHEWQRFDRQLYNRMERKAAWTLLSLGAIAMAVLAAAALYASTMHWGLKLGIGSAAGGLLLLFLNVLRARLKAMRFDRYREVRR